MFNFNRRRSRVGMRLAAPLCRRLSLSCVVFATVLTVSISASHAITECQSEKGAGYPWAWREIDGKRCWYKGQPGMDKKLLQWAESAGTPAAAKSLAAATKRSAARRSSPSSITDYGEHDRLLHSYWPPLPPVDVFNDRFDAARPKRL